MAPCHCVCVVNCGVCALTQEMQSGMADLVPGPPSSQQAVPLPGASSLPHRETQEDAEDVCRGERCPCHA